MPSEIPGDYKKDEINIREENILTYSSENHVEWHWNVKNEGVVVEDTDNEVQCHHHCILAEGGRLLKYGGLGERERERERVALYLSGTMGGAEKKPDTKIRPSVAIKRNWKKVTVFPAPLSSLGSQWEMENQMGCN